MRATDDARPVPTMAGRLAEFFRARPGEWIDGRVVADVAGAYAWRTRISDLRRPPFAMAVENRQRRVERPDGSTFTVSEYRYLPTPATEAPTLFDMDRGPAAWLPS